MYQDYYSYNKLLQFQILKVKRKKIFLSSGEVEVSIHFTFFLDFEIEKYMDSDLILQIS